MVPAATLLTLIALFAGACSGGNDDPATTPAPQEEPGTPSEITGDADPADVEVIDEWAKALTEGDLDAAAASFALPSIAENGPTLRIQSRADARLFNDTLPCGAELIEAQSEGDFTTATFRLTERPGPGECGPGAGGEAQTAFVVEDGRIVEWRRVANAGSEPAPGETVWDRGKPGDLGAKSQTLIRMGLHDWARSPANLREGVCIWKG